MFINNELIWMARASFIQRKHEYLRHAHNLHIYGKRKKKTEASVWQWCLSFYRCKYPMYARTSLPPRPLHSWHEYMNYRRQFYFAYAECSKRLRAMDDAMRLFHVDKHVCTLAHRFNGIFVEWFFFFFLRFTLHFRTMCADLRGLFFYAYKQSASLLWLWMIFICVTCHETNVYGVFFSWISFFLPSFALPGSSHSCISFRTFFVHYSLRLSLCVYVASRSMEFSIPFCAHTHTHMWSQGGNKPTKRIDLRVSTQNVMMRSQKTY